MNLELLEQASEAFRVYRFQSRYDIRKLAFRAHRAVVAACRPKVHEAAYQWLKTVHRETAARLSSARSLDDLRNIIDVEAWRKAGEKTLSPAILTTVTAGAVRTEKQAEGALSPITHRQIEAARKITSKLITSVDNETRKAISAAIAAGVKGELSVPQIARGIRPIIGLNERQGTAVWNFKDKLLERGLDFDTVMNRADSYASRLLTDRSTVIARTETSRAASQGTLTSYGDYNIKSVEWVADPEACELCIPNDGKMFTIEEAEGMIPLHPNCECTWVIGEAAEPGYDDRPEFSDDNLTPDEARVVGDYTYDQFMQMREAMATGEYSSLLMRENCKVFKGLFEKFKTPTPTVNTTLYRGVTLFETEKRREVYQQLTTVRPGDIIPIDKTICSFSTKEKIAGFRFSIEDNVRFELKPSAARDPAKELALWKSKHSTGPIESEVIVDCTNRNFKVVSAKHMTNKEGRKFLNIVIEDVTAKAKITNEEMALILTLAPDWKTKPRRKP